MGCLKIIVFVLRSFVRELFDGFPEYVCAVSEAPVAFEFVFQNVLLVLRDVISDFTVKYLYVGVVSVWSSELFRFEC